MKFLVSLPDEQVVVLDSLVQQGVSSSRNALVQQVISAFVSDLRNRRPDQNPRFLQSALGALAGALLFALGVAAISEIFGGE